MPSHIGKFEILRPLGQGAMGEVYLGKDPNIGREVAIKTIRPALAGVDFGGDIKERFAREAKAAGVLHHPNVVTVFEFGVDGDLLYLVMEYVPGEDLQSLLSRRELSASELLEVMAQVCEGLAQAHKHGIVHRDVKPGNVMVLREDGHLQAKVMDFGVAKVSGGDMTQTGQVVGTLAYMAPEYLRTGTASPQADLFSVGVMLYEGLSGEKPFSGGTTGAVVYTIIHDEPRPLDPTRLEGVSPSVRALVARMLAKSPEARFPGALELSKALRAARNPTWTASLDDATVALAPRPGSQGSGVTATSPSAQTPRPRWIWPVAAAGVLLLVGAGWIVMRKPVIPPVQAPSTANIHMNDVVLDEAARQLDAKPEHALKLVQEVIDATPDSVPIDPDAYALKMAIYYRMGLMEMLEATAQEAQDKKISGAEMLKNPKFKAMLEKDRTHGKKLAPELRERLLKGL